MTKIKRGLKNYYELAKPGIIYGNLLTAIAGFLFAGCRLDKVGPGPSSHFNFGLFIATVVGTAFVIGSACVFNNYTDREIDNKMERTKHRPLVMGLITAQNAITYANILGIAGAAILFFYTNLLTTGLEIFGLFSYVVFYGFAKRHTSQAVIVGSLPGAIPVVAGYCAVMNRLDLAAFILFVILIVWQMPHFYGISLYRIEEYRAAGIPVLPLRKGIHRTKIEMLVYTILFFFVAILPTVFGYTGYVYLIVMGIVSMAWILFAIHGFNANVTDDAAIEKWARKMFLYSLVVIVVFSVTISVGAIM